MSFTGGAFSTDSTQDIAVRKKWKSVGCKVRAISEAPPKMWPRLRILIHAELFVVRRAYESLGGLAAYVKSPESDWREE
jgi:hypothetical protein